MKLIEPHTHTHTHTHIHTHTFSSQFWVREIQVKTRYKRTHTHTPLEFLLFNKSYLILVGDVDHVLILQVRLDLHGG